MPNLCTITKGCLGRLFPIGKTSVLSPTAPVDGLTDWYPRGEVFSVLPAALPEQFLNMSTSVDGALTLALYLPSASISSSLNPWGASPPSNISVLFEQQLIQDIPYSEYIFSISASGQTIIQGKDTTGKNLRFSTSDVTNGLVFVLVNGVAAFPSSTSSGGSWWTTINNQLTFYNSLPVGATVTVAVYNIAPTTEVVLPFILNESLPSIDANLGAWGNIRWVQEYDQSTGKIKPQNWWIYSSLSVAQLGIASRLKLEAIYTNSQLNSPVLPYSMTPLDYSGIRFLLAAPPYANSDRYLNYYIDAGTIANNFLLLSGSVNNMQLSVDSSALVEMFPPFQLIESTDLSTSYISADVLSSTVSTDSLATRITGTKILGPV
jgi:hypothetical protein